MLVDPSDAVIARTIVALGRNLSLDVMAEGVGTAARFAFLVGLGCRSFQGNRFGTPLGADAFASRALGHTEIRA